MTLLLDTLEINGRFVLDKAYRNVDTGSYEDARMHQ
jgi:hypothetical protein